MSACASYFLSLIYSSITLCVPLSLTLPLPPSSHPPFHDQARIMDHTKGVIYRTGFPRGSSSPHKAFLHSDETPCMFYSQFMRNRVHMLIQNSETVSTCQQSVCDKNKSMHKNRKRQQRNACRLRMNGNRWHSVTRLWAPHTHRCRQRREASAMATGGIVASGWLDKGGGVGLDMEEGPMMIGN